MNVARFRLRAGGRRQLWRAEAIKRIVVDAFGPAAVHAFDRHYCLFSGRRLVAFAAVQDRIVLLDGKEAAMGLVGSVTTEKSQRGGGLGRMLMEFLIDREGEAGRRLVLNCGEKVKAFYLKTGFAQIAPKAGYERGGRIEWDDDPVLALGLPPDASYGGVFIGEDF